MAFNSTAVAVRNEPASITVDDISIYPQYGIVENKGGPLTAILSPESAYKSFVKWSSSDPSVISCTDDGVIKGISSGDYADITCKAKFGSAEDKIRIYCVDSIGGYVKNEFNELFTVIYAQPSAGKISAIYVNYNLIIRFFSMIFMELANIGIHIPLSATLDAYKSDAQLTSGMSCEVRGRYGSYAYVVVGTKSGGADGFVKYTKLKKEISSFLNLSSKDINVWGDGTIDQSKKLTTSYKGEVEWLVGDDTIVDFNKSTGQITGLKPGVTTITAKADGMSKTCTVHSLYKWPQAWITKTNQDTSLYKVEGTVYKASKALLKGKTFIVHGDNATDGGWAYGNIEGTDNWGYIPISHISTKNTISYYNNLNIGYPIKDTSIKYISSPYSKRSSDLHRGFDITGGGSYIYGEELASPVNGTVAYTNIYCYNNNKNPSYGYCITIISDGGKAPKTALKDTVTGNYFAITFMHMSEAPILREGDTVEVGDVVGKIGNTGNVSGSPGVNPIGTHLHFEINNMEALIENPLRTDFTYNINPIYFYMDKDFDFYTGSSAYQTYGAYWYGPDEKTEE